MKKIAFLLFLLIAFVQVIQSQHYRSIFSKDTTRWNMYECFPDAGGSFACYSYADTVIHDVTYKIMHKESLHDPTQTLGINGEIYKYIREDTINGKWWSLIDNSYERYEVLLMDLGLEKGGYFKFINQYQQPDSAIVDTVYFHDNRKIIQINKLHGDCSSVYKTLFVEGVGPTSGFDEIGRFSLLCKFDDNIHVYSTNSDVNGNCFIRGGTNTEIVKTHQSVYLYPNPVKDILVVRADCHVEAVISVYNFQGKLVHTLKMSENEEKLDVSAYPKGIYFIRVNAQSYKFSKQ